jgi:hypothetical protein
MITADVMKSIRIIIKNSNNDTFFVLKEFCFAFPVELCSCDTFRYDCARRLV